MMSALTRRRLLMGGAAAGALALGVGVYAGTATAFDFYKAMLHAQLPGVNIPDAAIHAFADDASVGRNADFAPKLKMLAAGTRMLGFGAVAGAMRNNLGFEKFNREFLTDFLLGSNFFQLTDPKTEAVEYSGLPRACSNPFAEFEPPAEAAP